MGREHLQETGQCIFPDVREIEPMPSPPNWQALVVDVSQRLDSWQQIRNKTGDVGTDGWEVCRTILVGACLTERWLAVRADAIRSGRIFIPEDVARQHSLDLALMLKSLQRDAERGDTGEEQDSACRCGQMPNTGLRVVLPAFRNTMHDLVNRTADLLAGDTSELSGAVQKELIMVRRRAFTVLRAIRLKDYDTLTRQPRVGFWARCLSRVLDV